MRPHLGNGGTWWKIRKMVRKSFLSRCRAIFRPFCHHFPARHTPVFSHCVPHFGSEAWNGCKPGLRDCNLKPFSNFGDLDTCRGRVDSQFQGPNYPLRFSPVCKDMAYRAHPWFTTFEQKTLHYCRHQDTSGSRKMFPGIAIPSGKNKNRLSF